MRDSTRLSPSARDAEPTRYWQIVGPICETADILGLTETAVKTRLSRARLRLRELLSRYYGERFPLEIKEVKDDIS